jgi:hypothetical protein
LGDPRENGDALPPAAGLGFAPDQALRSKRTLAAHHTINITGNPDVPASTYAKVIVDTAASLTGGRGQNPFFPTKAQIAIQSGIEILRHIDAYVTIPNLYHLLLNPEDSAATIEKLANAGDQRSHELLVAFREGYLSQPVEQLGGVQGTISTYLALFPES